MFLNAVFLVLLLTIAQQQVSASIFKACDEYVAALGVASGKFEDVLAALQQPEKRFPNNAIDQMYAIRKLHEKKTCQDKAKVINELKNTFNNDLKSVLKSNKKLQLASMLESYLTQFEAECTPQIVEACKTSTVEVPERLASLAKIFDCSSLNMLLPNSKIKKHACYLEDNYMLLNDIIRLTERSEALAKYLLEQMSADGKKTTGLGGAFINMDVFHNYVKKPCSVLLSKQEDHEFAKMADIARATLNPADFLESLDKQNQCLPRFQALYLCRTMIKRSSADLILQIVAHG